MAKARLRLGLLQLVRAYGPFLLVLKVFIITALLGLMPLLGALGHTLTLLGFAGLLIVSFIWSARRYDVVGARGARRAVERASGLVHRPLSTLADQPVSAPHLWRRHRERVALELQKAKLSLPKLNWAALDHRALRLGTTALLLLVLAVSWEDSPRRLQEAARPPVAALLPSATLDAWITPPAYTGQAPFALRPEVSQLSLPEGSTLQLRVTGGWFPPVADVAGKAQRLTQEDAHSFVLNLPITQAGPLLIRQDGRLLGRWSLQLLLDTPPSITFARPPAETDQQALRIDFTAIDDLGLAKIEAVIEPGKLAADSEDSTPIVFDLPLRRPPPLEASGFRFFDLTAHPWAGNDVIITLRATDVKGQMAESEPVATQLPAKTFTNPIAKALIKVRKELVVRGMGARQDVMTALNQLAGEAEDDYAGDWVGPLALRIMVARLRLNNDPAITPGLVQLMWDTALHFEDGGINQALYHLRESQQALEDAISRGAEDEELQKLMDELQQALSEYLDRLEQEMTQQQPGEGQMQEGETITREQLEQFLNQLREQAQSGQREQAQQMLQQLQQLMENLRGGGGMDPQMQQSLRELEGITREQQQLLDRTLDQAQPGQRGQHEDGQPMPGEGKPDEQGENGQLPGGTQGMPSPSEQGELGDRLGGVLDGLEERGLGTGRFREGQQEMEGAEGALEQQQRDEALRHQGEALNRLQQGLRELREQMRRQQAQQRNQNSDPFGRERGDGGADNRDIEIPEQQEADRARQVLEELRRRAGDFSRPQEERDYLDRLLKWF